MTSRTLLLCASMAVLSTVARAQTTATTSTPPTTSTVFQIVDGRVVFPGWDDRQSTEPESILALEVDQFLDAHVYRERMILTQKAIETKPFDLPDDATTFTIIARSRPAGDIFPRLRISLVTPDNNKHKLFEGYWQTISLETYKWPLNEYVRGKKVRLNVEMLNAGTVEEQRAWYFLRANVY